MTKTWWRDGKKVTPENNTQSFGDNSYKSGYVSGGNNIVDSEIKTTTIGVEDIMEYLQTKGCTLWVNWDISSEEGLKKASEWLADEIYNVLLFVSKEDLK